MEDKEIFPGFNMNHKIKILNDEIKYLSERVLMLERVLSAVMDKLEYVRDIEEEEKTGFITII